MHAAKGILTTRGGMTSHAAVVARGMGRPCVAGAGDLRIDYARAARWRCATSWSRAGDLITLDGATGEVILGAVPTIEPQLSGDFATLMDWADELPHAEGARQCRDAARCRDGARVRRRGHRPVPHRAHVLRRRPHRRGARDDPGRRRSAAGAPRSPSCCRCSARTSSSSSASWRGLPVTIRLLDPPLHEFLPHDRRRARGGGAADRHRRRRACGAAPPSCTRPTRCSAIAAAGSASPIPRSTRCRRARSSRRRSR